MCVWVSEWVCGWSWSHLRMRMMKIRKRRRSSCRTDHEVNAILAACIIFRHDMKCNCRPSTITCVALFLRTWTYVNSGIRGRTWTKKRNTPKHFVSSSLCCCMFLGFWFAGPKCVFAHLLSSDMRQPPFSGSALSILLAQNYVTYLYPRSNKTRDLTVPSH